MDLNKLIIQTLKEEVVPAMGCTEPVAVALACAKARELVDKGEVEHLEIFVSPNIYKNGLAVGVPPTDEVGLYIAGALGTIGGKSEKGLEVLADIGEREIQQAKAFLDSGKLTLSIKDTPEKVYIEVSLTSKGNKGKVIIQGKHNRFVYIERQGEVLLDLRGEKNQTTGYKHLLYTFKIKEIIEAIERIPHEELDFMLQGLTMNEAVAMEGLKEKIGMGVGYTLHHNIQKGILSDDMMNCAMMLTAAASDARMAGIRLPVMSSNGSGNNGLTAILPIVAYSKKFPVTEEQLAKAVAMSHMVNSYIKHYIGRLSALCGCGVAAGTGAAVAMAWLMGASKEEIDGAIKNMIGNISGMICDGAKVGCALKLSASASAAVQSALLATNHQIIPAGNGIIAETAEETIYNLKILSEEGMPMADHAILKMMQRN